MRILRGLIIVFFILMTAGYAAWQGLRFVSNDTEPPIITCSADTMEVSIDTTDEELLAGMSATDGRDGNVTDSLVVVSKSKFSTTGKRKVSYAAFDSHSNVATYTRTITYSDYTSPRFSLSVPLRFTLYEDYDLLNKVTAKDCLDGDITSLVKLFYDSEYSYGRPGDQLVTLQVTNSAGDTVQLQLALENLSDEDYALDYPALSDYIVYAEPGEELDLSSYVTGYCSFGNVQQFGKTARYTTKNVKYDASALKPSKPGVYRVIYTLYDSEKEAQGSVSLYVIVEGDAANE